MKNKLQLGILILLFCSIASFAQNTWLQKANYAGRRIGATGFSIGTKGYIGTGFDSSSYQNDFWEFDPSANTWTQKANFGGATRAYAVGVNIGSKGYIGTGLQGSSYFNDWWEYDPSSNTWTQKSNFAGTNRAYASAFSTGNKGFVCLGRTNSGPPDNDLWEYDQSADTWTQKSNYAGGKRSGAFAFAIGGKGYVGTGASQSGSRQDFWEYDTLTDVWNLKDSLPNPIYAGVSFTGNGKGYAGLGQGNNLGHFWAYDPSINFWSPISDFPGVPRQTAVGFSINNKGYVGTGENLNQNLTRDFWEYTPCTVSSPTITFTGNDTICSGDSLELISSASSGNQWYRNSNLISGATQQSYWVSQTGSYSVTSLCSGPSISANITLINFSIDAGNSGTILCGNSITLNGTSSLNATYSWYPSTGLSNSSILNPVASPVTTTMYHLYASVTSPCVKTLVDSVNIIVTPLTLNLSGNSTINCGDSVQLIPTSNYTISSYSWYPSAGLSSNSIANPFAHPNTTTIYHLMVTTGSPCNYTALDSVTISVGNSVGSPICIVTVDTSINKNKIIWEQVNDPRIASYNVYKETTTSNVYAQIGNIPTTNLSEFTDNSSNPTVVAARYELSTVDTCGIESALSSNHKTIHLTISQGIPPAYNLNWDAYEGITFGQYKIWRGNSTGALTLIDSIQNNLFSYTDLNPPTGTIFYALQIVYPQGCNPSLRLSENAQSSGSTSVSNIMSNLNIGMDNYYRNNSCSVFPNPVTNEATIKLNGNFKSAEFTLYDVLGNVVLSKKLEQAFTLIQRGDLPAGIYYYKVTNNKVLISTNKLIIE